MMTVRMACLSCLRTAVYSLLCLLNPIPFFVPQYFPLSPIETGGRKLSPC